MNKADVYRQKFEEQRANTCKFVRRCIPQAVANLPRKASMRNADEIEKHVDTSRPALIAAAGPSLTQALDVIRSTRDRITLYAVDTAYPALLCAGIYPDLVVTLDPEGELLKDTLSHRPPEGHRIALLAPTYLHADPFDAWTFAPIFFYNVIDHSSPTYITIARYFHEYRGFMAKPNVAQFSVNVAFVLGHPALAWAGMDHATRPEMHYADGVVVGGNQKAVKPTDVEILTVDQSLRPIRTSGSYILMAEAFIYHYVNYYKDRPCFNLSDGLLPFARNIEAFKEYIGSIKRQNATQDAQTTSSNG